MRTAIWAAVFVAVPLLCSGMYSPQQTTDPTPKDQRAAAPPQPSANAGNGTSADDAAAKIPVAGAAEPAKMAAPPTNPTIGAAAADNVYVIGLEDQITITVWGDNRLSASFTVRPDGRISMNLIGELMAAGRTPRQLATDIENQLKQKEILKRPQVNVEIRTVQSRKYMINGEILKPGSSLLLGPTTVLDALVNAGGFKDFANRKRIQILRGPQRFRFNWNEVIKGKNLKQNILLEPGDLIIVP
jgi:polysaccharide export outer membrane protein